MKKIFTCIIICLPVFVLAQVTTTGMKWKDGRGVSYTYFGEIRDGLPNGAGAAISDDGFCKLVGEFKNGMPAGTIVEICKDGKISIDHKWGNDKLDKRSVLVTPGKILCWGNREDSVFNGNTFIADSMGNIFFCEMKNSTADGRVILAHSNGTVLSDNIFTEGQKNGQGYEFNLVTNKLDEATWKNNERFWGAAGNYPSFMRNNLQGSVSDQHNMVFHNTNGKELLEDTCFYWDKVTGWRSFGNFINGKFSGGIVSKPGTGAMMGPFNKGAREGVCVSYSIDDFLIFGNYSNDVLSGYAIYIDLGSVHPFVYFGQFSNDESNGQGVKLIGDNELKWGTFVSGFVELRVKTLLMDK